MINMTENNSCIRDDEIDVVRKLFKSKEETLVEELANETKMYETAGLFSNRDTAEIDEDLRKVRQVLKDIENLPRCKNSVVP